MSKQSTKTSSIYKRKMASAELQEHLKLGSRARTFADKKKQTSKLACRNNNKYSFNFS